AWIVGIVLLLQGQWLGAGWFHAKFAAVLVMTALHGLFSRWVNEFRFDRNRHSQKFYRIVNEIPTGLLIVIVVLVVVKPF
ncbi:MAG: CopD family protein, partial [Pseudolabrys sp.]